MENEIMMKNGYYIHFQGRMSIGVSKKIDMQIEEFTKKYRMQELEIATPARSLAERLLTLLPFASIRRNYRQAFQQLDNPDFIYVRRTVADKSYCYFWRSIKEAFPNCKIIIEVFTYPYDKDDFAKWNAWPFYLKEIIYRRYLKKYIDRFVTYTIDRTIFGVPTICSTNGIKVESIRQIKGEYVANKITLIGVAYMQRHHGYERIIQGMKAYYENTNTDNLICLYLVGDGPEKARYQEQVKEFDLQKYVTFYPTMSGEELDDLYDECDLGLASFGMYKLGFYGKMGALKTREYLAKGIPFMTGCPIDVLDDNYKYVKVFSNDNTLVDMEEVIDFYKSVKANKEKAAVADEMREYAVQHVSIESVMQPIIDYIES